jgi:hypothetical protein
MKVETEKAAVLKQIKQLEDPELIHAIKSLVDFGLKKQTEQSVYNISGEHKKLVRERIKSTKPEQYMDWDKVKGKLKA